MELTQPASQMILISLLDSVVIKSASSTDVMQSAVHLKLHNLDASGSVTLLQLEEHAPMTLIHFTPQLFQTQLSSQLMVTKSPSETLEEELPLF